ncbi:hypothetical protein CVCC1112_3644 [Paenarthrobacter nicotinovorans]|nr:hypothetical protein ANMWB30_09660 [Arthrobacter sp. MWB30]GAT88985.1 hypothetical protein CVCC1112_3644 [Paenarthrobacter nicotinovorans]
MPRVPNLTPPRCFLISQRSHHCPPPGKPGPDLAVEPQEC